MLESLPSRMLQSLPLGIDVLPGHETWQHIIGQAVFAFPYAMHEPLDFTK